MSKQPDTKTDFFCCEGNSWLLLGESDYYVKKKKKCRVGVQKRKIQLKEKVLCIYSTYKLIYKCCLYWYDMLKCNTFDSVVLACMLQHKQCCIVSIWNRQLNYIVCYKGGKKKYHVASLVFNVIQKQTKKQWI